MKNLVYIIILNYNGWEDTINCINSILRNNYVNYKIIICDNASKDNSIYKINKWLEDKGILDKTFINKEEIEYINIKEKKIVIIDNKKNLGFAGGCNVGIKYAMKDNRMKYIWLLNNDTSIDKQALVAMIKKMDNDEKIGICGSSLLYYDNQNIVQALGGFYYNKWLGISKPIGAKKPFNIDNIKESEIEKEFFGIIGASMLIRRNIIEEFGYLEESYFLYFEEQDIAVKIKEKYKLGFAKDSIVYHKEGASIGGNSYVKKKKSILSDFYMIRNRLIFTKRYYPKCIYTVYLGLFVSIFNRIRRKQYIRVKMIINLMLGKEEKVYKYLNKNG